MQLECTHAASPATGDSRNTAANSSRSSTGMRPTLMMSSVGRDPSYTPVCLRPRFIIDTYPPSRLRISKKRRFQDWQPLRSSLPLRGHASSWTTASHSSKFLRTLRTAGSTRIPHCFIFPIASQMDKGKNNIIDSHLSSIQSFNTRCIAPEYRYVLEILPQGLLARINTKRRRPAESGSSLLPTTCTQPANSSPQLQPRSSRQLVHQSRSAVGGFGAGSVPSLRAALIPG